MQTSGARKLSVTKTSIYAAFSLKKCLGGVAGHPGPKTPFLGDIAQMVSNSKNGKISTST